MLPLRRFSLILINTNSRHSNALSCRKLRNTSYSRAACRASANTTAEEAAASSVAYMAGRASASTTKDDTSVNNAAARGLGHLRAQPRKEQLQELPQKTDL